MKYANLPFDAYRLLPGTNWTRLKSMKTSPLQYRHDEEHPREETAALRIGVAAHAVVLEPGELERRCVVFEGARRAGKEWEAFKLAHAGKMIFSRAEWDRAIGAGEAIKANKLAQEYLREGLHELAVTWTDPTTGMPLKCRVDHAGPWQVEVKTTGVFDMRRFTNLAARMGYVEQLAFQDEGLAANDVVVHADKIMIVVDSKPPHDVMVGVWKAMDIEVGRREVRELLGELKKCRESGRWPGIAKDELVEFSLPSWKLLGEDGDIDMDYGHSGDLADHPAFGDDT